MPFDKVLDCFFIRILSTQPYEYSKNGTRALLPTRLKQFKAEDIFNTDETELFYQCLPDSTYVLGKLSKERLTAFVTASMVEEKLPPLVIGKSANPRCFKSIKKLPMPYESNKKAWMIAIIFEVWIKKLDSRMRKSNRTVALVLNTYTAPPNVIGQTNVKLIFLTLNTNTIATIFHDLVCVVLSRVYAKTRY